MIRSSSTVSNSAGSSRLAGRRQNGSTLLLTEPLFSRATSPTRLASTFDILERDTGRDSLCERGTARASICGEPIRWSMGIRTRSRTSKCGHSSCITMCCFVRQPTRRSRDTFPSHIAEADQGFMAKTEFLQIRCTAADRERIRRVAEAEHLEPSTWARRTLLQAVERWETKRAPQLRVAEPTPDRATTSHRDKK